MRANKKRLLASWLMVLLMFTNIISPAAIAADSTVPEVLSAEVQDVVQTGGEDPEEAAPAEEAAQPGGQPEQETPASQDPIDAPAQDPIAPSEEPAVFAGQDRTDLILPSLDFSVTQNGNPIAEGDTFNGKNPLRIAMKFNVPVVGETEDEGKYVSSGDTAEFNLGKDFSVVGKSQFELKFDKLVIGDLTLHTTDEGVIARVVFKNLTENDDITEVNCQFNAELQYNGENDGLENKTETIQILDKTFKVEIPAVPVERSIAKQGTINLAEKSVKWTVTVDSKQNDKHISLEGYQFADNLSSAGAYLDDSFEINGVPTLPAQEGTEISYTFPETDEAQVITFKTAITDDQIIKGAWISNKADLKDAEGKLVKDSFIGLTVKSPTWITKTGAANGQGSDTQYNPKDRTITWTIDVNHGGVPLEGVTITDVLPTNPKLTFKSAKLQAFVGKEETPAGAETAIDKEPTGGVYDLGDISTKTRLTIVTEVPNDEFTAAQTTYNNNATVKWGTYQFPANASVTIGYNPIEKTGVLSTKGTDNNPRATWTVSVNPKEQTIPNAKVYDLLVYDKDTNLSGVEGIPDGVDQYARYGQKLAPDTFAYTAGAQQDGFQVTTLTKGGVAVADLLEIKVDSTAKTVFTFDTLVVDPDIFAANGAQTISNKAALFSADRKLNEKTGSVQYPSAMLAKEMLHRDGTQPIDANRKTTNEGEGFDYADKSVIYRLSVNAAGLDFTKAVNEKGEPLGVTTLTDTLPQGWEFVNITDDAKYLIYKGTKNAQNKSVTATGTPVSVEGFTAEVADGSASFEFETLDQPYVILVKARPSEETQKGYFTGNKTTPGIQNDVTLKAEKWSNPTKQSQRVSVESKILGKEFNHVTDGQIRWTVDYNPYDQPQENLEIQDILPQGIELRIDNKGNLIFDGGNITLHEMTLGEDGRLQQGPAVADLADHIHYDSETRELTFQIPNCKQAYSLTYLTDITADSGNLKNNVKLVGSDADVASAMRSYNVNSSDASATLKRGGKIQITKIDDQGKVIQGAVFVLTTKTEEGEKTLYKAISNEQGKLNMRAIPVSDTPYTLKEIQTPDGYVLDSTNYTVSVTQQGDQVTTTVSGNPSTLEVVNKRVGVLGDLTISKTVTGDEGDKTKAFEFTVTLEGAGTTSYRYVGTGVADGTIASGGTISLAHGQSITITGLPKDTAYTVTEKSYAGERYETSSEGARGVIEADQVKTAAFTNHKERVKQGGLTISKTVAGNAGETNRAFEFTVTLAGTGSARYDYSGSATGTIASGEKISLMHGQSITIQGIPDGVAYTVTEADYQADGYKTVSTNATGAIADRSTKTAAFTNTKDLFGGLTIRKTVAGNAGDNEKKFDFTVRIGEEGNESTLSYNYTGTGVPNGTITSGGTISLAHGESITITGIAWNTPYTVTEADYSGEGYVTTSEGSAGVIAASETKLADFVNTRDKFGGLTISKTVAGNAGNKTKSFDFTVKIGADQAPEADAQPTYYDYTGVGIEPGKIASGDTISLAHGQSITITGIVWGTPYTVTEADYRNGGYRTVSTGAAGVIVADGTVEAVFTNTRNNSSSSSSDTEKTGNLVISKTVVGENADLSKKFEFTVELTGASGAYKYTGASTGTLRSGDKISLAHGESITISGLPKDAGYTVTEADYTAEGYTAKSTGAAGKIETDAAKTAAFTNEKQHKRLGSLTISKKVAGEGADQTKKFDFTVTLTDAPQAYAYTGAAAGTLRSGDKISLAHGESITITGLPEGAAYTVAEADYAEAGYTAASTGAAGKVVFNETKTAAFINTKAPAPEKPNPEKPNPEKPQNPGEETEIDGKVPGGWLPNNGKNNHPSKNTDTDTPYENWDETDGMPRTGDTQNTAAAKFGMVILSIAFGGFLFAEVTLRKKNGSKK